MSPSKIQQKCVQCGVVFEKSKFNPYLDKCEEHRGKKTDKKISRKQDVKVVSIKQSKKEEVPSIILPSPPTVQFKKAVLVIEKEKIFIHLLGRGWKLSNNNKLYKNTDKVKIIATLGSDSSPSQKFTVSFWTGDSFNGFDGSLSVVDKAQLKKLPTDITDDIEPILNYIWPEEKKDEEASK